MPELDVCPGSFEKPEDLPPLKPGEPFEVLPHGRCPECGHAVEKYPLEPGGEEVWRLQLHDTSGRVIRLKERKSLECPECSSNFFTVENAPSDGLACACKRCGHEWVVQSIGG